MFVIDKEYDLCPVGKPQFDMKYRVVDDDGNVEWMAYPKIDVVTCENKLGELSYRG